jgi:hypothetical protein
LRRAKARRRQNDLDATAGSRSTPNRVLASTDTLPSRFCVQREPLGDSGVVVNVRTAQLLDPR